MHPSKDVRRKGKGRRSGGEREEIRGRKGRKV
jgi:hypothetical protein